MFRLFGTLILPRDAKREIQWPATTICLFLIASSALAETPHLWTVSVAQDVSGPVFVTAPPGDTGRIFVVEQIGTIRVIDLDTGKSSLFLSIEDRVAAFGEAGLLGLAFHPNFSKTGHFFVYYANRAHETVVLARFTASHDALPVDPKTEFPLLVMPGGSDYHLAGWIGFGPAGFLYVAVGDMGRSLNAQDISENLAGKLLRVDVDRDDFPEDSSRNYGIPLDNPFVGKEGDDEIWALGLRNPWRCSFDRLTGDLIIADVGNDSHEEINFQRAGAAGGANYGWPHAEGDLCSPWCINTPSYVAPVHTYGRSVGNAVVGGYVYRGRCAIPEMTGRYIFGDFGSGKIWSVDLNGSRANCIWEHDEIAGSISSFGEDAEGELYMCTYRRNSGAIRKIVPHRACGDCDRNGVSDACQLADGTSEDLNSDGILDHCVPTLRIVESDPPHGAIDARQRTAPGQIEAEGVGGSFPVTMTFDGEPAGQSVADVCIRQTAACADPPSVSLVHSFEPNQLTVQLERRPGNCTWTTFAHREAQGAVRIGVLPGNVNGDRTADSNDLQALLDSLESISPRGWWSTDIDRSGAAGAGDIVRLVDILNRAGTYAHSENCELPK